MDGKIDFKLSRKYFSGDTQKWNDWKVEHPAMSKALTKRRKPIMSKELKSKGKP